MQLLNIDFTELLKLVGLCMGILSPVIGVIVWLLARLLDSRKDKLMMQYEINDIKDWRKEIDSELDIKRKDRDWMKQQIDTLLERTKKL